MGLDDNVKTDVAADAANDTDEYQKSLELQKQISLRHSMQYELPKKHQKAKEEDDDDDEFDLDKFPVREWKIQLPWLNEKIAFNPLVSGVGVTILWGLAIWCMGKLYGRDLIYFSHTKSKFQISL